MGNLLRAIAVRIELWPGWLKAVALGAVAVVVIAAVAVPVTLRLRAKPVATVHRTAVSPSPTATPLTLVSPGSDSLVADLTCRLPVSSYSPGSGGFVSFPSAAFTSDPGSNVTNRNENGYTGGGFTYDRALGKWLAAPRSAVTPDGARYVYWDGLNRSFRLVTATSGAETALGPSLDGPAWAAASTARQNGGGWNLVEAGADGVYATPPYGQVAGAGLWFFPYSGSAERQVATFGYWHAVGGNAAWGTSAPSAPQGATVTIVRFDLSTGAAADWFSQDGMDARVYGFDSAGHPVVVTTTESAFQVWLVDQQKHGTQLLALQREQPTGGYQGGAAPVQSVVGDAIGVWMATSDGLYLYRNGATQKVSTVTGLLGGGCG